MVPASLRPASFLPLWECGETVVGCRRAESGTEFVTWYADAPGEPEPLAVSELGLWFWLFSYLIEDQDCEDEPAARQVLAEAARAVGFRRFAEIDAFQQRFGHRADYDALLRDAAKAIPD